MSLRAERKSAARKTRARIQDSGRHAARVFISGKHIYVQIVNPQGMIVGAVSSLSSDFTALKLASTSNLEAARQVGRLLGQKVLSLGLQDTIAFDRSGKMYHGKVRAIAEAARDEGVKF